MAIQRILLELDFGAGWDEAKRYLRANPTVTLAAFLRRYPARARAALPPDYYALPLQEFNIDAIKLRPGDGVTVTPTEPSAGPPTTQLRQTLDAAYQADVARDAALPEFPKDVSDGEAVHIAYRHELHEVARFLKNDLSVLIACDKILTEHIYEYVCQQAGRLPVLDDAAPARGGQAPALPGGPGGGLEASLRDKIRNLKNHEVLVLRGVDMLDHPALIEVLYESAGGGKKPQLLGFLDPSLEAKKVLTDRFAVHVSLMGLPRYIQPDRQKPPVHTVTRLVTAEESRCFQAFDPEGLYKNVSGLNAVQFRNAMRYVGATLAAGSESRSIYEVIRSFKISSSSEIEIPDTGFEDIGGYERLKQELQRTIDLMTGSIEGLDDRERQRLIPRGFVFHGPPGTGKTLFAKAIANRMNATIQMISGPEIMDKYVGQSESNLRRIFATARRNAPSVIFFDEFDSLASQRSAYSDGGARANNAVVAQFLTELDGFRPDQSVLVIGTTNRIDIIDEALLRPSRLRPIEIGLPDYEARRHVARIHARNFGVDKLLTGLVALVLKHLAAWSPDQLVPQAFLDDLLARHKPYQLRYQAEGQRARFVRELADLFALIKAGQMPDEADPSGAAAALTEQLADQVRQMAAAYGLDLSQPDLPVLDGDEPAPWLEPMQADIRDLFKLVQDQHNPQHQFSPETFLEHTLDLIADYTLDFNNDEIRAIFQEASLEHHLEGQLITPRYLGLKIGLLRKRRDERQVVHLSDQRGRRR